MKSRRPEYNSVESRRSLSFMILSDVSRQQFLVGLLNMSIIFKLDTKHWMLLLPNRCAGTDKTSLCSGLLRYHARHGHDLSLICTAALSAQART